jgi:hypothetical protein
MIRSVLQLQSLPIGSYIDDTLFCEAVYEELF